MLFTQPIYLLFFAITFVVSWVERSNGRRKLWLLVASYVFYAGWDWRFLSLILASTVVDFVAALMLTRSASSRARRVYLVSSLVVNLGILGFFKYYGFFLDSATRLLGLMGIEGGDRALAIVLPVGISFFTFQSMSYTLDVYRGRLDAVTSFLDFALFVAFFPQLVAGPIVRASRFLPQLTAAPSWSRVDVRGSLTLFLIGFVKKSCVADNVAVFVDQVFDRPTPYASSAVGLAVVLYAVQIYCDFSGYSDMAIASARLLGYELGPNFRFPYLAENITEFWRRWHISLSTWLRDYLYIPLGGNRGSVLFTYRNLMITMLLGGLWHGAAWTFVFWGALHGLALVLHREWKRFSSKLLPGLPGGAVRDRLAGVGGMIVTFYLVGFAWIFFRAESFQDAAILAGRYLLLDAGRGKTLPGELLILVAILLGVHILFRKGWPDRMIRWAPGWLFAVLFGLGWGLALSFVPLHSDPFIYFQF